MPKEISPKTIKSDANMTIASSLKNKFSFNDISLEPLCKEHLRSFAPLLQAQDRAEMWASYRLAVEEALEYCRRRSAVAVAFLYRGEVCAVSGVEADSLLGNRGSLWSWTGEKVKQCPKAFWQVSRRVLQYFLSLYPHLYVLCDARYAAAQRYVERLGGARQTDEIYLAGPETRFVLYQFHRPSDGIKIQ